MLQMESQMGVNNFLVEAIHNACSQNPASIKDAEHKIQQLEIQPGYCINLLTLITDYSLDKNIRLMACVCLKNAVDKFWRRTAPNSIKEEERVMLKDQFLQYLNEPDLKLARQMSLILGKLARFELPHQWPDLIPKLLQIVRETTTAQTCTTDAETSRLNTHKNLVTSRCLMALHQIIKSLASKRLLTDRRIFEELALNIVDMLIQLAFFYVQNCLLSSLGEVEMNGTTSLSDTLKTELNEHSFNLDQAILCLKILHKLILHGFKDNTENVHMSQLMLHLYQSFEKLITKRDRIVAKRLFNDVLKERYEYLIVLYVDMMSDYQETYPYNFIETGMNECLQLVIEVCFTANGKRLSFEKMTIHLMNFLKAIIMCEKYKTPRVMRVEDPAIVLNQKRAAHIKATFLTSDNLKQILGFLFNEYLLVVEDELTLWRDEPEEFINDDGTATDAWKFDFRACAETLFQAFVHECHDLVVPIVVELIQVYSRIDNRSNGTTNPSPAITNGHEGTTDHLDLAHIDRYLLLKDASYNCASIAAWELVSHVDFDSWLTQSLLPEVAAGCHVLIKRRILILIATWVNIKLSPANRPAVYQLLCQCMQANEDLVIRLQATLTLKAVLDDIHYEKDTYLPYLSMHFALLCQLLKKVTECDTKIKVLAVISFLIERVDIFIRPYSAQLASYLPILWGDSADHNMLRCAIVSAFYHIVKTFGANSVAYHSFLVPVIHYSTDINNAAHIYLQDEGLELWNITIQNSVQMTPDLLKLFENIKPMLERDTDVWKLCLEIIDSYVVLDARQLFQFYGDFLINKCVELLTETIKIDALLRLMRTINHMFEAPADHIQVKMFEPFILKGMNLALNDDTSPLSMAINLSMLAKPVLEDCPQFMKIVEKCAAMRSSTPEKVLGDLLDSWIDKIDMIVHPEKRKLTALAIISLLRFKSNVIYERFAAIINLCVTVLLDVLKDDNGVRYDCLVVSRDIENDDEDVDTEHEKRKRRLRLNDPVYSISLKDYCLQMLRECESSIGVEDFQRLMSTVDKSAMQKLNDLLRA